MLGRRATADTTATTAAPSAALSKGRTLRVVGAVTAAATAGSAALLLAAASGAGAAPHTAVPTPSYTAGNDDVALALTGAVDGNCPVSTGGSEIWIKPGDKITFRTTLAGVNVNALSVLGINLSALTGQIAGMNVSGWIGSPTNKFSVAGGKTTVLSGLSAGTYNYSYTASSVSLLPALNLPPAQLSSSALKSGAKLTWTGKIYVTTGAAQCKISVGTPTVGISVGPIKLTVPPISVAVPVPNLPSVSLPVGGTTGGGHSSTPTKTKTSTTPTEGYTPPGQTVPERTVPQGGGGGGFYQGSNGFYGNPLPDTGSGSAGGSGSGGNGSSGSGGSGSGGKTTTSKQVDLAANRAPAAQMPVLLAILAIIALSLVTATYARLYLLRRNTT